MAGSDEVDVAGIEAWLRGFAAAVSAHRELLTRLDSAIGDADHGANLDRGMTAVVGVLDQVAGSVVVHSTGSLAKKAAMTLVSNVGGASGPLYGTFFLRFAASAGEREVIDAAAFAKALRAGLDGVVQRGGAAPGDKTMVDALAPALDALDAALGSGASLGEALRAAAAAAEAGRDATTPMRARKGRASYLGERSVGHQDPGATSAAMLVGAAAAALGG